MMHDMNDTGRPGDDGFDEDGYDESQRAEILETTRDGPGDGTIITDLDPDLGGAAPGDEDDDLDDDNFEADDDMGDDDDDDDDTVQDAFDEGGLDDAADDDLDDADAVALNP